MKVLVVLVYAYVLSVHVCAKCTVFTVEHILQAQNIVTKYKLNLFLAHSATKDFFSMHHNVFR